jgi:CubicO group peptidase (beta-lactamase class C family)
MNDIKIHGACPARFQAVREAFEANFAEDLEIGARFALVVDGALAIDLWAGHADRAQSLPFEDRTLTPVFSTTKAVAAFMVARLVDQGRLAYEQPVADLWPDFAQAGKSAITVEQALSHQAGLSGFPDPIDPTLWFDWDGLCAKLAEMAPLWPPGTASGYHPITYGYLAGEIFRRVDGRTLGTALRQDIAEPFGLDLWIGLPDSEHGRCAEMRRPPRMADLGEITPIKRAAFLTKWASPGGRGAEDWRRAEIPSANGHATAPALARLMSILACDGRLDGHTVLSPGMAARTAKARIKGQDLVLPYRLAWGAGFMRNEGLGLYGPGGDSFGHSGWGGSCAFADPARRVAGAYVMNKQSAMLIDDPRPRRLIEAAYGALG